MHFLPLSFTLFLLVQDVKALETEEILGILQVLRELLNCSSISLVFPPDSDEDSVMPPNGDLSDFSAYETDCFSSLSPILCEWLSDNCTLFFDDMRITVSGPYYTNLTASFTPDLCDVLNGFRCPIHSSM